MVAIDRLSPGMRVKIVNHWVGGCLENEMGRMDKYLGSIMTVDRVYEDRDYAQMLEDKHDCGSMGWCWYPAAIERIVDDEHRVEDDIEVGQDFLFDF